MNPSVDAISAGIEVSPGLIRFSDTCNVYAVRTGAEAVLVDFGSGLALQKLASLGIPRVSDVLMTHHHRDQGQGLPRAVEAGIRIWVPAVEQDLFRQVDAHWQRREIFNNYNTRQDRFSLITSVPIAGPLPDYARLQFGGTLFTVVPTPGHTPGSISLLAEIDGKRVAFTGDLIAAPGKVWSLAATQWTYNGAEGVAATIASLLDLKRRQPDILLPSHGDPILAPGPAIDLLVQRLWELLDYRQQGQRLRQILENPYQELTPHLLHNRSSVSCSYVLLSESKKALVIDYGYDFMTGMPAGSDRASRRPWLYSLETLKKLYGVHSIEVAIPTHYHDDHVAGLNLLRQVEGTQVWAAENFAAILGNPANYDLPCLWYDPIPVDRVLPLGETIPWEEYEICLHQLPGHTLYAAAISFEVDGKRVLAAGDQHQGPDGTLWNYVYQNHFRSGDYRLSADLYQKLNPDLILSGHWDPYWVQTGFFDTLTGRGAVLERLHHELLPVEALNLSAEGPGMRIEPYQTSAQPGERLKFAAFIRNPFPGKQEARVSLIVPEGWQVEPGDPGLTLDENSTQVVEFEVLLPIRTKPASIRLALDITLGDHYLGQQAEALVKVCAS